MLNAQTVPQNVQNVQVDISNKDFIVLKNAKTDFIKILQAIVKSVELVARFVPQQPLAQPALILP